MLGNSNLRRNTNKIYRKTHRMLIYSKHSFFFWGGMEFILRKTKHKRSNRNLCPENQLVTKCVGLGVKSVTTVRHALDLRNCTVISL